MKTATMNRLLIKATVHRTLERLTEAPEREIRNLIDMGMAFSNGRFQKQIFATAQTMLQNPDSAYYTLVNQAANHIDHKRLLTFVMNIGYESCTKGAATIRTIEAKEGFNIPWAITLSLDAAVTNAHPEYYERLLNQCTNLGIYTILLHVNDSLSTILPLIKKYPRIAFVLFLKWKTLSPNHLQVLKSLHNVMIFIADDGDVSNACEKLYTERMLYGIYRLYNEANYHLVIQEQWLDTLLQYHPTLVITVSDDSCPVHISNTVYQFICQKRDGQHYPFILMDLQHDLQLIDQSISDDLCLVCFDKDGTLHTLNGRSENPMHNFFKHPLKDILKDALKK